MISNVKQRWSGTESRETKHTGRLEWNLTGSSLTHRRVGQNKTGNAEVPDMTVWPWKAPSVPTFSCFRQTQNLIFDDDKSNNNKELIKQIKIWFFFWFVHNDRVDFLTQWRALPALQWTWLEGNILIGPRIEVKGRPALISTPKTLQRDVNVRRQRDMKAEQMRSVLEKVGSLLFFFQPVSGALTWASPDLRDPLPGSRLLPGGERSLRTGDEGGRPS